MRILLHACCAPCSTFPLFLLRAEGHMVDVLFLNPNIDPLEEVDRRWTALAEFGKAEGFSAKRAGSSHEEWLAAVSGNFEKPTRCRACYLMRLSSIAEIAKEEGYDAFTTSLLVSIYQDHDALKEVGEISSAKAGIPFIYRDFRVGYRRSREIARGRHMYMQKYCGCEFSLAGR